MGQEVTLIALFEAFAAIQLRLIVFYARQVNTHTHTAGIIVIATIKTLSIAQQSNPLRAVGRTTQAQSTARGKEGYINGIPKVLCTFFLENKCK